MITSEKGDSLETMNPSLYWYVTCSHLCIPCVLISPQTLEEPQSQPILTPDDSVNHNNYICIYI